MNSVFEPDQVVAATKNFANYEKVQGGGRFCESQDAIAVPDEFICPITLQIMVYPIMTRAGINFERSAIMTWLQKGSGVCPMTRTPLAVKDIVANTALDNRIHHWCQINGVDLKTQMPEFDKVQFIGFVPLDKKLLKRFERQARASSGGAPGRNHHRSSRSPRHGSSRQHQSSSSDRSERLRSTEVIASGTLEPFDRMPNFRTLVAGARRAAAA